MDLEDQLLHYFGTADVSSITREVLTSGVQRMNVDLGLARDPGRRFALWTLLYMLGSAPDIDVAFANEADREAARDFMDMADKADQSE